MKSVSILALAATASATGWNDFGGFNCPDNTDNKCNTQQESGWDWSDLQLGSFSSYGGFSFGGFECEEGYGKREPGSRFAPRTSKALKGSCGHEKESSPSFGCGQDTEIESFSVSTIDVITEFDADLEFHFSMGDGSTCKQRSSCSSQGSTVKNSQCGGAKNVTIVYPSGQSGDKIPKASSTCGVSIPTVSFDCSSASSTTTKYTQTHSSQIKTSTVPAIPGKPTATGPSGVKPSSPSETGSKPSLPPVGPSGPGGSQTTPVASQTPPSPSSAESTSPVEVPSSVESTTYEITSTAITSFQTTSTVYSTSIQTITSCGPEVVSCPAGVSEGQTATTTVVVAVSTTICPVTATETSVFTTSHAVTQTQGVPPAETTPAGEAPPSGEAPPAGESSTSELSPIASTTESPAAPTETLPCPTIVPACISTWNFVVGCVDNADASCYCPDANFVQNVYQCLYAYGDSDETIAEAIQYFQGICGSYAGNNPAVATGASVTTYLTVTATPPASATTIVVHETTVVPCTNSAGEILPSSSSTVTVSTVLTVPQVALTTYTASETTQVGVVPVTSYPASAVETAGAVSPSGAAPGGEAPYPTGSSAGASGVAQGTTALVPSASQTTVVTAGAGRTGASLGAAFLAVVAVLAL
ncbi:hypothetical protein INS49_001639 [Diaporthe citri]|uniref:uncharacterized protein n=1 Tax=Diaporthe citri TaxID=83186 RepID=UPI001C7E755E|nr:uncharacterized protein INS49_001639 [Diaporthe citri]KAG6367450.1 hypothetical protein INS49_001639 [Diaporthe citri]